MITAYWVKPCCTNFLRTTWGYVHTGAHESSLKVCEYFNSKHVYSILEEKTNNMH
jgi:hypothetical protein